MLQRLDKILAGSGLLTRSQAKEALRAGRVQVDGVPARDGAAKVDPETAQVTLDGATVAGGTVVLLLNKPAGYVTSTRDPRDPTVMELLPPQYHGLAPVGRLDKDTSGLLLLTDDGQLAHRLISPRHAVWKIYDAVHEGEAGLRRLPRRAHAARRNGLPPGLSPPARPRPQPCGRVRGKVPSGAPDAGQPRHAGHGASSNCRGRTRAWNAPNGNDTRADMRRNSTFGNCGF